MNKIILWLSVAAAALALVACGDSGTAAPAAATTTTITGSAVKGPVNGATVTIRNASTNAVLGTTTTTISGAYSITTTFVGDVLIEISGGSYIDEASGVTTTLATPMRTVLTANGGSVVGMVTPLTTMAYTYSGSATPTAAVFNVAAARLVTQLGLPTVTNLVTATPIVSGDAINAYGRSLRAVSQYLQDNPGQTLGSLISTAMGTGTYASFSVNFANAYNTINGQTITVNFTGNTVTISGVGGTGSTDRCGLAMAVSGITAINVCYIGIPASSCSSANAELNAAAAQVSAALGQSVQYNFTTSCVASPDFTFTFN